MGTNELTWFNQLPVPAAQQALMECCSAPGWAELMAAGRPYPSTQDAIQRSSAVVAALTTTDLAEALAGHPRIGERPATSPDSAGRDGARAGADWSRREQVGVDADDTATNQALSAANLAYEQRFGHIYLVYASGRSGKELLALLRGRLQNGPEDEWQVVRTELQKINALRLERLLDGER